eukprot:scaffold6_cov330-Pavlova_lutheri.AAC.6
MFCTISPSFILRDGSRLGFGSLHVRASRVRLMPMEQHGESHWFPEQYVGPVAPWFGRTATFHVLDAAWSTPVPTPFRGSIPPFSTISRPWILPRWKALVSARLPVRLADTSSPRGRETSPLDVSLASFSSHPGRPPRFEPARPKGLKGDVSGWGTKGTRRGTHRTRLDARRRHGGWKRKRRTAAGSSGTPEPGRTHDAVRDTRIDPRANEGGEIDEADGPETTCRPCMDAFEAEQESTTRRYTR